ncbi:MAG: hypothetical protein KDA46_07425 [Parvularculaceae bacterium]|nr:hypothetical protein [Parvularculaceae bacterium]
MLRIEGLDRLRRPPSGGRRGALSLRGILEAATHPRMVLGLEIILIAATTFLAGLVFWLVIGPLRDPPVAAPAAAAPTNVELSGPINPFRTAGAAPGASEDLEIGPDLAETTLNMTLHGTWVDADGGSAIINTPSDEQKRFHAGDTIWNNVTLERVYRDQVVISRGGVRESLRLINRDAAARRPADPAPQQSVDAGVGLVQLGDAVTAIPRPDSVGGVSLVLQPSRDKEAFLKLGLRPGDILVAVDNQRLGPDIAETIRRLRSSGSKKTLLLSVERGGVVTPVSIPLGDNAPLRDGPGGDDDEG